jgi:predicted nucleic acid-binding Zn ribbon protein
MYCQKCGKEIPDGSVRCPFCEAETKAPKKKKKKTGCLIAVIAVIAIIAIILVVAISSGSDTTTTSDNVSVNNSQQNDNSKATYQIGDTVTVKTSRGDYSIKFTGVRETSERNEFADDNPQRVVILEYEYKNISFDSDVVVSYVYFRAYDKDGNSLTVYPDTSTKSTTNISQGKTATASVAYGLNSSDNIVTVDFYDITMESLYDAECTFNLTW